MNKRSALRQSLPLLCTGALLPLAFAPFALTIAAPFSIALYYWLTVTQTHHLLRGWMYGLGVFGLGASWVYVSIHDYGHAPVPLAALLTILFCAGLAILFGLQSVIFGRLSNTVKTDAKNTSSIADQGTGRPSGLWRPLAFAGLWVLFEWTRSWLLTGFPWLYAGYAALNTPLAGWAPVTGVFGNSLLFALIGALFGELLVQIDNFRAGRKVGPQSVIPKNSDQGNVSTPAGQNSHPSQGSSNTPTANTPLPDFINHHRALIIWLLATLATALGGGYVLNQIEWTQPVGEPQTVAMYQPNIDLIKKWDRRYFPEITQQYAETTRALQGKADIVVWPESAIPAYKDQVDKYLNAVVSPLVAGNQALITGIPSRDRENRYNSIAIFGASESIYHKQKLVPFGEYVPLEDVLRGLIRFFDLPMSHFKQGPADQAPLPYGDLTIAPYICYEVVYPDFVAATAGDSELLITISNDSWFGHSIGPIQHLEMAQFRALETGKPMIRGTNNGISALIDYRGQLTAQSEQFVETTLTGTVHPRTGKTPFSQLGSWPVLVLSGLLLLPLIARRHRDN